MGAYGSRYCLFSIDTSDVAQFPRPQPPPEDADTSPCAAELRVGQRHNDSPDASQPWLPRSGGVPLDIDAPPRPLEDDDLSCSWGECCNVANGTKNIRGEVFSSRDVALSAARRFSQVRDFDRAFSAYRQALDMRRPAALPGITSPEGLPFPSASPITLPAPDDAPIYDELAKLCFDHNKQRIAALFYERATWLDKENVEFWYRRGVVYQNGGEQRNAIKCFERCLELDPSFVPAMFHLGVVKLKRGRCKEALKHFNQLLSLEPTHIEGLVLAADCYDRLHMVPEALRCIDRVLAEDPSYFAAQRLREKLSSVQSGSAPTGNGSNNERAFERVPLRQLDQRLGANDIEMMQRRCIEIHHDV